MTRANRDKPMDKNYLKCVCKVVVILIFSECHAGAQVSGRAILSVASIRVAAPETVVFRHAVDRCSDDDIPDYPARAVRLADGKVAVLATHFRGRFFIGPDILSLHRGCEILYQGADDPDPAHFDDRQ
jgi:hypothetical protein